MATNSISNALRSATLIMHQSRFVLPALSLIALGFGLTFAWANSSAVTAPSVRLAIVDFVYLDTSGELSDQAAPHRRRLQAFMAALRQDFTADERFHLVTLSCGPAPCNNDTPVADLHRAVSDAGANILVTGGIHKQSTLVQWAKVTAIAIDANRVVLEKLFTFRGDSDEAWGRAESFISQDIRNALAATSITAP
jgi:hypothetical protein